MLSQTFYSSELLPEDISPFKLKALKCPTSFEKTLDILTHSILYYIDDLTHENTVTTQQVVLPRAFLASRDKVTWA